MGASIKKKKILQPTTTPNKTFKSFFKATPQSFILHFFFIFFIFK